MSRLNHPPKRSLYANLAILLVRGLVVLVFLYAVYLFYEVTLRRAFGEASLITTFILLWLFTAYVFLPRVHRFLTRIYLPDYYIGRAKTAEGMLGDPINLAVTATRHQLHAAMLAAGWKPAEPITFRTSLKSIFYNLMRKSYPNAPVSSLMLFSRKQDMAYQKEVPNKPWARHHVRFWRVPEGWFLPGGYATDWLGAATFDKSIGLSLFTGQVTHKIDKETDQERDYLIKTLEAADVVERLKVVEHFTTAYHHRNGGGDSIQTDGSMPFLTLKATSG